MTSTAVGLVTANESKTAPIQAQIERAIDDLLAAFPSPGELSAAERIIARYTAVLEELHLLETGAYISVGSDEARAKIIDNLREEVRDCHPGMMHGSLKMTPFQPMDAQAVYRNLMNVRLSIAGCHGADRRAWLSSKASSSGSCPILPSSPSIRARPRWNTRMSTASATSPTQELFRALKRRWRSSRGCPSTRCSKESSCFDAD